MKQKNYWKIATIVLIIIVLLLVGIELITEYRKEKIQFGDMEIDKEVLEQMVKVYKNQGQNAFKLCDMSEPRTKEFCYRIDIGK